MHVPETFATTAHFTNGTNFFQRKKKKSQKHFYTAQKILFDPLKNLTLI